MWLYSGLCFPNRSFSKELSAADINTQIHKVLDHGANSDHGVGPAPLREGVASTRVSLLESISAAYAILSFHHARGLAQGLGGARSVPRGANLPEDTVR
jgi:hypothetical protein